MSEKPTAEDAIHELRLLTTCRCAPDWTERDLHDPHCVAYYREEVDIVADELERLRAVAVPPSDSCSTCGAGPNEPCRYGCAYQASRRARGWKELPTPTVLSVGVLEEIEAIRREMPDDI